VRTSWPPHPLDDSLCNIFSDFILRLSSDTVGFRRRIRLIDHREGVLLDRTGETQINAYVRVRQNRVTCAGSRNS
jgi:hypothetical protein